MICLLSIENARAPLFSMSPPLLGSEHDGNNAAALSGPGQADLVTVRSYGDTV